MGVGARSGSFDEDGSRDTAKQAWKKRPAYDLDREGDGRSFNMLKLVHLIEFLTPLFLQAESFLHRPLDTFPGRDKGH